jgi:putative DNA primase/helicase
VTAADIAKHLAGRKAGSGWVARCPAHDDRTPSLSLKDADGCVLVHCHAGCAQSAVVEALKRLALWPERDASPKRTIVATYAYTDEAASLLYQVDRYHPKGFRQRRPDDAGGWVRTAGERQVLYRLRKVLEAPIVFVVEGEKDCEALRDHGFVATTNSGGAGKWGEEFNQYFHGKEVLILPDADPPGWRHALDIARSIVGIAADVKMIELPHAKDPAEWFARGHSELELIRLVEEASETCCR